MDVASQLSHVDILIGADTVVESPCGAILEKPEDDADALRMLKLLSGREHAVHTGCVLISFDKEGKPVVKKRFSSTTKVTFDNVGEEELKAYIETREPFGKAGAYGIQGRAGVFVNHLIGCYFNVVGLPINRLSVELRELVTTEGDMKI
jgi:septum formation protein